VAKIAHESDGYARVRVICDLGVMRDVMRMQILRRNNLLASYPDLLNATLKLDAIEANVQEWMA